MKFKGGTNMSMIRIWLLLILFAISGIILFYKNGKLVNDIKIYSIVVIFTVVLSMVAYFSMPNAFYIDRVIAIICGLAAVLSLIMKNAMFFLSKVILIISMSVSIAIVLI